MDKITKNTPFEVRNSKGKHKCIRLRDILYIYAGSNGIIIVVGYMVNNKIANMLYTHSCTMDDFMFTTGSLRLFCRVHNKYIINMDEMDDYDKTSRQVNMNFGVVLSFSDDGLKDFMKVKNPLKIIKNIQRVLPFDVEVVVPVVVKVVKKVVVKLGIRKGGGVS